MRLPAPEGRSTIAQHEVLGQAVCKKTEAPGDRKFLHTFNRPSGALKPRTRPSPRTSSWAIVDRASGAPRLNPVSLTQVPRSAVQRLRMTAVCNSSHHRCSRRCPAQDGKVARSYKLARPPVPPHFRNRRAPSLACETDHATRPSPGSRGSPERIAETVLPRHRATVPSFLPDHPASRFHAASVQSVLSCFPSQPPSPSIPRKLWSAEESTNGRVPRGETEKARYAV